MRPPQNAGESRVGDWERFVASSASMRPPQNAGESCEPGRRMVASSVSLQ